MKLNSKAAISLTVALILGVIVTAILVLIYNRVGGLRCVKDPFNCIQQKSVLELASECVMTICTYGCGSPEVMSIEGKDFSCAEQCDQRISNFIEPSKYCGFQFPIKIEIPEGVTMKVNKETINQDYLCFMKFDGSINSIKIIVKTLPQLSLSYKILLVKDFSDNVYSVPKDVSCPPISGKEIESFEIKGEKTLFIYGDITPFISEDRVIYSPPPPSPITFITDEPLYSDIQLGESREIVLKYQGYYPLENNYGLIIKQVSGEINDIKENGCNFGNDYVVYLDVLCSDEREKGVFCSITDSGSGKELEFCNGKYKIKAISLPSSQENIISNPAGELTPYVFSVTKLR